MKQLEMFSFLTALLLYTALLKLKSSKATELKAPQNEFSPISFQKQFQRSATGSERPRHIPSISRQLWRGFYPVRQWAAKIF